ncbi:MAG: CTP synthase, partial [Bacillota bacterium]
VRSLDQDVISKLALFCDVRKEAVIANSDTATIYEVPLMLEDQGLGDLVMDHFGFEPAAKDLSDWRAMVDGFKHPDGDVRVAIVGKYVHLHDAYMSVVEALVHAGIHHGVNVKIDWVDSETLESRDPEIVESRLRESFGDVAGIVVPGGFGYRGIEGKIEAIRYARENRVPFLGLCLGLQCSVIEFARNVVGLERANSTEFDHDAPHPVIDLMPEQKDLDRLGGTMRLGTYPCELAPDSLAARAYGQSMVQERHRHRYEINNEYRDALARAGLRATGVWPEADLVEIMEIEDHPWFLGVQFHPEFKSRPNRVHPLFRDFLGSALREAKM